ncbi:MULTISPECIES: hypothetical protein [Treponema]|nr:MULTISPECIES: hypothetical protein [Treponema]
MEIPKLFHGEIVDGKLILIIKKYILKKNDRFLWKFEKVYFSK